MLRDLQHAAPCVRVERHGDIRDAKKGMIRLNQTCMVGCNQSIQHGSNRIFHCLMGHWEVCFVKAFWGSFCQPDLIECRGHSTSHKGSPGEPGVQHVAWRRLFWSCSAVPQLFAVSFQPRAARESLAKAGLQPEETPRWHQCFVFSRMSPFRRINRLRIFQDVSFHAAELNHIQERHDDLRVPLEWHSDGIVMNPRNQNESTILAAREVWAFVLRAAFKLIPCKLTHSQVPAHAWERKRRLVARWGREE